MRPIGCRATNSDRTFSTSPCAAIRCSSEGDCTVPGQIALHRMPVRIKSAAIAFVSPTTAAFVVAYTNLFGAALMLDAADDMFMMLPFPAFSIPGKKAPQVRYIDLTFRSKEKSQSFSEQSRI